MALPRAALFLLLALLLLSSYSARSQPAPISLAPSALLHPDSLAPSQPPSAAADDTALSPPAPSETSPLPSPSESPAAPAHLHSAAPAPAPAADKGDDSKDPSPAPAPHAEEIKAGTGGERTADADQSERHEGEMNGGKKAAVVVGAFTAAAMVGLAAVLWRKRQANIRRSRYADYSARLELV